ncbi:MAG: corrinoid methyltransferase [Bellilinea sp.]|nr:MAG: corrinoid methyltransferase [Bellilinea sp.]GIV65495.1 MAG: corrinoid methyltransferase [Bellilinea sp.]
MENLLSAVYQAILEGDQTVAREAVQRALEANLEAEVILKQAMMPAMQEVGRLFEEGEYFVPEMLVAARAMQAGMNLLKPRLVQAEVASSGKVVAGTVKGDLHDIGKNLVCMMLEGAAFEIIDLGTDVPPEKFVEAVESSGAQLVALSALLTTTMPNMKQTIEALQQAGLRQKVRVMVGGAPVTETFARQIGADGYAPDASRAVSLAKSLMGIG